MNYPQIISSLSPLSLKVGSHVPQLLWSTAHDVRIHISISLSHKISVQEEHSERCISATVIDNLNSTQQASMDAGVKHLNAASI